ncbi:MAG: HD-GYP domain-containing protein, partial [Firmicutes bacterium]|nr:HD-GYP domain-containing protein [Bacillota bacterium]
MRFVPTNCLRVGMVVGENLYNQAGDLLLSRGTPLTDDYIYSIERLKYNGIYIEDDISKEIDIINVVSDKVRAKTVTGVKSAFVDVVKNPEQAKQSLSEAKKQ